MKIFWFTPLILNIASPRTSPGLTVRLRIASSPPLIFLLVKVKLVSYNFTLNQVVVPPI